MTQFFVLSRAALEAIGLTEAVCTPLLTKAKYARGLSWRQADVKNSIESDQRILLVRSDIEATDRYWAGFPSKLRHSIETFKKRPVWNAPDDGKIPDAFFFGLINNGPRLVINDTRTNCNNSIYRIYFHEKLAESMKRSLALMFLSSYVQVSGELIGRVCGSGGLKFEPSDALNLKVIQPPAALTSKKVDELWPVIDLLLRNGRELEAVQSVDMAIKEAVGASLKLETISLVNGAFKKLRKARSGA